MVSNYELTVIGIPRVLYHWYHERFVKNDFFPSMSNYDPDEVRAGTGPRQSVMRDFGQRIKKSVVFTLKKNINTFGGFVVKSV